MAGRLVFCRRSESEPESSNAYFDALIARPDLHLAYSLRPVAGNTNQSSPYWEGQLGDQDDDGLQGGLGVGQSYAFSYDPGSDTHPNAQDACKHVIPPYVRVNSNALASDIDAVTTTIPCTNVSSTYALNRHMKIDDEIMKITARDDLTDTFTVLRAQQGTTAVPHTAGTFTKVCSNTTPTVLVMPVLSGGEKTRFFFVWDAYYTDSFVGTGLTNHKAFQISSGESAIWFELNNTYGPSDASTGDFQTGVDVAAFQVRSYTAMMAPPMFDDEPIEPIVNTFAVKPNKWTRYFALIDVRSRDDAANYHDVSAELAAGIDSAVTSFSVDTTGMQTAVPQFAVDQYIMVDSEIMTLTASVSAGNPRTLNVTRGARGTTPAAHSAGAAVKLGCHVRVSAWIADEDREPVEHFSDYPVALKATGNPATEDAMRDFEYEWNTSNTLHIARSTYDLVAYHKNWACLKSDTLDPVADGLLEKPVVE